MTLRYNNQTWEPMARQEAAGVNGGGHGQVTTPSMAVLEAHRVTGKYWLTAPGVPAWSDAMALAAGYDVKNIVTGEVTISTGFWGL